MIDNYAYEVLCTLKDKGRVRFGEFLAEIRNPRTLSQKLRMLQSFGLIEVENKLYRLSEKGRMVQSLLEKLNQALETRMDAHVDRVPHQVYAPLLKRYCEILCEYFKDRIIGILLFGSIARGDWNKASDIDLLVIVQGWNKPVWERGRELLILRNQLRQTEEYRKAIADGYTPIIQHYPLDVAEAQQTHRIYIDASIDGLILYEKDFFLTNLLKNVQDRLMEKGARRVVNPNGVFYWVLKDVKAGEVFEI
jgi:hypothetical protein